MSNNIHYKTSELSKYFSKNRIKWNDLYESERNVLNYINPIKTTNTLDIGCGCGGLGLALKEKFSLNFYTGVEINKEASNQALKMNKDATIYNGDFLKINFQRRYGLVVSLSCIDWNKEFNAMLEKAWSLVIENGYLVISLRLTLDEGINSITDSFQYINYENKLEGEIAPYVVLNYKSWLDKLQNLQNLNHVYAYGYYGTPSSTAITPFKKVCFSVFALNKSDPSKLKINTPTFNLNLPIQ